MAALPSPPHSTMATTAAPTTTTHKKHTRHHVKRRSTGRVHVTKLAPMARANAHTDTEAEDHQDGKHRPNMRRSQSQRSLNRLSSFDRKGGGLTSLAPLNPAQPKNNTSTISPPTTPPLKAEREEEETSSSSSSSSSPGQRVKNNNPAFVLSQRGPAEPVEQTFNAVANNLVAPDKAALPAFHKQATSPKSPTTEPTTSLKKRVPPLRSQFIDEQQQQEEHHHHTQQQHPKRPEKSPRLSNVASAATAQPHGISRTQQKLLLQRQHCLVDDENNLAHPRNMRRLTHEMERVAREYRCVRRYRDPMLESLERCLGKESPPQRLQPSNRTRSSSVLPTSHSHDIPAPHSEQRQAIHRRQHQLKMLAMNNNKNNSQPSTLAQSSTAMDMIRWSAGALLDRVWYGSSAGSN
ncbi:hypothetical protein BJV82DRAFT_23436 [Fennellomyces sp. T-0311]|nr:hypothetical protein BJV82DRAFT_23436 [Fennellomyces sp. T-0311]